MAISKTQFKEVLDAIFNNGNPDTEYINSANTPAIKMYVNEMLRKAELLKREDSNNEYVVAILQTENHPYLDDNSEIAFYTCKDIKDAILTTVDDLKEYNRGISSYIPMKTYIRNICAFLGVNMSANFDTLQPVYYQDMVEIVKKYCTLNNKGLAYWARYDVSNKPTYKSYVPVMCLVDIAVYLNELRLFSGGTNILYVPQFWQNFSNTDDVSNWMTLGEMYQFLTKNEVKKVWISGANLNYSNYDETFTENAVNAFLNMYGNDIDFSKFLIFKWSGYNPDKNVYTIQLLEIPTNCILCFYPGGYNTIRVGDVRNIINYIEDFNIITYDFSFDGSDYTYSKVVNNYSKETMHDLNKTGFHLFNIKNTEVIKPYGEYCMYSHGSGKYYFFQPLLYNPFLTNGQNYTIGSQVKTLNEKVFLAMNDVKYTKFYYYLKENNITVGNNDLMIYSTMYNDLPYTYGKKYLIIIRNINTIFSHSWRAISEISFGYINFIIQATQTYNYGSPDPNRWTMNELYCYGKCGESEPTENTGGISLTFDGLKDYEIYDINNLSLLESGTLDNTTKTMWNLFKMTNNYRYMNNRVFIGEVDSYLPPKDFDGLTKMTGATYPSSVIDLATFISTYSGATYRTISNPYYEDSELVTTNLHTDTWVACNTTKNIPVDQSTAQNPDVDNLTDDDMKDIDKDIKNSTDNNDDEDDDSKDNPDDYKKDENEGENKIPTIDDVFHYGYSSFINQWVLNKENLNEFGKAINNKDFIDLIVGLVADPLDALISLQVVPISLMPKFDTTARHIYIRGQELLYKIAGATEVTTIYPVGFLLLDNVSEFDLGKIEIGKNHDNYLDVDETKLTLYLPFAGNIELDIRDFYGGSIHIKGFCETYTGQLIYYIISEVDNLSRIITTITANCFSSIPLKSDGFASLLNGFTRG